MPMLLLLEFSLSKAIQDNAEARGRLNIKMLSNQYRGPHVKDKAVSRPSYL